MVLCAEPLITPILTATAGRHALVAAARAVVRGGAERGGTGAGATPGGSAGGVGSAWTWSGSPAVVRGARLQGWVVAADAPTAFQHAQPLLQAADDLVQLLGLAPGNVKLPLGGGGDVGALDHLDLRDVQLSLCTRRDPGDESHLALARVYLALEGLDPPAEVDNSPPGGIRVAVPWWVVRVSRGSSRRASAGSARSRGSSPARWSASRGSTWRASSRGS